MPGGAVAEQIQAITAEEARSILLSVPGGYFKKEDWVYEETVGGKGGLSMVCLVGVFAALGGGLFGLDIGYISGVESMQSFLDSVNGSQQLDATQTGLITGIFALGAVVAAFPSIVDRLTNWVGRKGCTILGGLVFCVGATLQGLAPDMATMCVGRFVAGAAVGILSATVPVYQGEIAPPAFRGMIIALYQLAITIGILVAFFLNFAMSSMADGWRYCILCQLVPGVSLFLGGFLMPRSPRWLVSKGRHEDAYRTLVRVRSPRDDVRGELALIYREHGREMAHGKPTWKEFCSGTNGRLLLIGVGLQIVQQLCGMNMFMYYGPKIFAQFFQGTHASLQFQFLSGIVNAISTLPGMFLVDRAGRMRLLQFSAIGMLLSCVALATVGPYCHPPASGCSGDGCSLQDVCGAWSKYALTGSIFAFITSFGFGWGPVVWIYCAEIFSLKYRTKANGLTTDANWVGNFFIGFLPPILLNVLGFHTFWIFAGINVLALAMGCALPETKGRSLEDIQEYFGQLFGTEGKLVGDGNGTLGADGPGFRDLQLEAGEAK